MKKVSLKQAQEFKNSEKCKVTEYGFGDKDIDISTAKINGRYPETGYCVNLKVKELVYVLSGSGKLCKEDDEIEFKKGDAVLLEKNEKYYWNANCTVVIACSPAWYPDQHKLVD